MGKKTVYLAGAIAGLTAKQATNWRNFAKRHLADYGIGVRDPMRDTALDMNSDALLNPMSNANGATSTQRAIVARDRFDVQQSDAVLFNLIDASRVSIGTMVELGWANAFGKPTIVMIHPDSLHTHPFVAELADVTVDNIYDAMRAIRSFLNENE